MGFAAVADRYQAKGFSIMPLKPKDKRPMVDSWVNYQKKLPEKE